MPPQSQECPKQNSISPSRRRACWSLGIGCVGALTACLVCVGLAEPASDSAARRGAKRPSAGMMTIGTRTEAERGRSLEQVREDLIRHHLRLGREAWVSEDHARCLEHVQSVLRMDRANTEAADLRSRLHRAHRYTGRRVYEAFLQEGRTQAAERPALVDDQPLPAIEAPADRLIPMR